MGAVDGETPPIVRRKMSEVSLINNFREAKGCGRDEVLGILSRYQGELQSIRDPSQKSLLHIACEIMDFIVVKTLVEQYALDVNEQDSQGNTPLHIACQNQMVQTVVYLTKAPSCDPNSRNNDGFTPLHIAARNGPGIIITHLLTMPTLDRGVLDREGRDAITIIRNDPVLASSLDRKMSTVSLSSTSSLKSSEDREVKRKGN